MSDNRFSTFKSAEDFLSALFKVGFGEQAPRALIPIFRGVADVENYRLLPTALRRSNADLVQSLCTTSDVPDGGEFAQRHAELSILLRFYERANRLGLAVPGPRQELTIGYNGELFEDSDRSVQIAHGLLPGVRIEVRERWLPPGLVELAALAQHYGLPTRLLDWTHDAATAAYFAARSAASRLYRNVTNEAVSVETAESLMGSLGVWVLNVKTITDPGCPLEIAYPPYAGNPNLAAQQGVLTHWRSEVQIDEQSPVDREPLDEKIPQWNQQLGGGARPIELHCFTLPASQCTELCKILDHRGYNPARLMPGYAGAARAVEVYGEDRLTAIILQSLTESD